MSRRTCRGRRVDGADCEFNPRPYIVAYKSANQNLPLGTVLVTWDVLQENESITLDSNAFTVPETGLYICSADITFTASATGDRQAFFAVNGDTSGTAPRYGDARLLHATASSIASLVIIATIWMQKGDIVDVRATGLQDTDILGDATNVSSRSQIVISMLTRLE